ncbi:polyketide synthase [Antarcticimicrobium sediminis]|uniref:Polyketide synthase n=2 Tax=Antarcticimicrobium sediminis TaxID=2546227 RepID=A0A4R5EZW4_9RHOB|nr:polyketide synthase [Antarcticimicrobium sediminis]
MKALTRILPLRTLVVLLVVALSTSGFAHRFMTPDNQAALDYAQSFGLDVTDICGGVGGKGAQQACDACLLHASMSLPEPAISGIIAELSLAPADWVPHPPVRRTLTAKATRPARAPPTV